MTLKRTMEEVKSTIKNWWLFLVLGILLIAGGIMLAGDPVDAYIGLSIFASVWIFVSGVFSITFAVSNSQVLPGWGWYLAGGILEFLLGVLLMCFPGIMAASIPFILGFWLMFRGISIIASSMDLSSLKVPNWGWLLVLGILIVLLSFLFFANPAAAGMGISLLLAATVIVLGIASIVFAFQLKSAKSRIDEVAKKIEERIDYLKENIEKNQ